MNRTFQLFVCFVFIILSYAHSQPDKRSSFLVSSNSTDAVLHEGVLLRSPIQLRSVGTENPLVANRVTYPVVGYELPFERLWSDSLQSTATTVVISKKGTILVGCGFQSKYGILRSTDRGQTWKDVGPQIIDVWRLTVIDSGSIYASTWGNPGQALLRSKDDGKTWEAIVGSPPSGLANLDWGFDIAVSPKGDYFFATNEGMWRSLSGDSSWTPINNGIPPHSYRATPASVKSPVFLGNKIYVVRSYDLLDSTNEIMVSTDNGDTWSQAGKGIPKGTPLKTLLVHGNLLLTGGYYIQYDSYGTIYHNSIYVSKDSGASWEVSSPNFDVQQLRENSQGYLFAAANKSHLPTYGGIYQSLNNGITWEFIGLGSNDVWGITFDDAGYCFVATLGYYWVNTGLYRSMNPITSVGNQSPAVVRSFSLFQNYPNPFNPSTTIEFSVPVRSDVRIVLVNMLGQVVKEVIKGNYTAGTHEVKVDASNLPSGVYFYNLQAGSFTETKKLVLLR